MSEQEFDIIIEKERTRSNYFRDLWRFRELFYILSWRDIKVRYKQTIIGILWAVIRPLLTMIIFTVVFNRIAKIPSEGDTPYFLLVLVGMLPWQFFSTSVGDCANSLLNNERLITKVYFPRMIIPASTILTNLIDFAITLLLTIILLFIFKIYPTFQILIFPLLIVWLVLLSFGLGLWLSSLNVEFRDVRFVIPFLLQIGLYISPVGYSSQLIPQQWQLIFACNPMVGIIDLFRWSLLKIEPDSNFILRVMFSFIITVIILCIGIYRFRKIERNVADVL
ncbi:MAG: ABC transporter permease [Saprospiraceae bacterium]